MFHHVLFTSLILCFFGHDDDPLLLSPQSCFYAENAFILPRSELPPLLAMDDIQVPSKALYVIAIGLVAVSTLVVGIRIFTRIWTRIYGVVDEAVIVLATVSPRLYD